MVQCFPCLKRIATLSQMWSSNDNQQNSVFTQQTTKAGMPQNTLNTLQSTTRRRTNAQLTHIQRGEKRTTVTKAKQQQQLTLSGDNYARWYCSFPQWFTHIMKEDFQTKW